MIVFPALLLMCVVCIPLGGTLIYMAFDHPDPATCEKCRYFTAGLPSRCCPECGHLNPRIEDAHPRLRRRLLFAAGLVLLGIPVIVIAGIMLLALYGGLFVD